MEIIESDEAKKILSALPRDIFIKLSIVRELIFKTACEIKEINKLEETLKWGEPAYLCEQGSTIRINAKKSSSKEYAIYFNCKTKLVDTFRERYPNVFLYEGNRAIVLNVNDEIPVDELKQCLVLALTYKSRVKLPLLGI